MGKLAKKHSFLIATPTPGKVKTATVVHDLQDPSPSAVHYLQCQDATPHLGKTISASKIWPALWVLVLL